MKTTPTPVFTVALNVFTFVESLFSVKIKNHVENFYYLQLVQKRFNKDDECIYQNNSPIILIDGFVQTKSINIRASMTTIIFNSSSSY